MPTPANALAIMAKAPLAGSVKTRLVPALTAEQAAGLYRALLLDQFDHLRNFAGAERYVFHTPADAKNLLRDLAGADYTYLAQSDGDLGVRMQQVFTDLRLRGHRNIVLIGSDLPALPWSILDQAFEQLAGAQARVVLGPSRDGGYYLLGMNRPTPEIFAHMTWSHPRVLAETTMRLDANNLSYSLLPTWFDIDVAEDLQHFARLPTPDSGAAVRRTMQYLAALGFRQDSKSN